MYNNPDTMQNPEGFRGDLGPLPLSLEVVARGRLRQLLANEANVNSSTSRLPEAVLGQAAIEQAGEQDNDGLAA